MSARKIYIYSGRGPRRLATTVLILAIPVLAACASTKHDGVPLAMLRETVERERAKSIERQRSRIEHQLGVLAIGLQALARDNDFRMSVTSRIREGDGYPGLLLREALATSGVSARFEEAVSEHFGSGHGSPALAVVDTLIDTLLFDGRRAEPRILIPHFFSFEASQLEQVGEIGFSFLRDGFPVPCLTCANGMLFESELAIAPVWILTAGARPWHYINGDQRAVISNCEAEIADPRCRICPFTSGPGPLKDSGSGGHLMHHEIEISMSNAEECLFADQTNPLGPVSADDYARLSTIPGMIYWDKLPDLPVVRIRKVIKPIIDRHHFGSNQRIEGEILTLCGSTLFSQFGEASVRFGLAQGGVYVLSRPPVVHQPKLYFAFPYGKGIWFSQGPDMRLNFLEQGHRPLSVRVD